jgi:hypothetical protein
LVSSNFNFDSSKCSIPFISNPFISKPKYQLFGYDGFYDSLYGRYYFSMGDAGVVSIRGGNDVEYDIINTGKSVSESSATLPDLIDLSKRVNSVSNDYEGYKFLALSSVGNIWGFSQDGNWAKLDSLELVQNEEVIKFIKDFSDTSILILTSDSTVVGSERLHRWSKNNSDIIYKGDISKAITTPDGFIYILESIGGFSVLNKDGKKDNKSENRLKNIQERFNNSDAPANFKRTDVDIFHKENNDYYSIAFASDRGLFYSTNEKVNGEENKNPFEFINKPVSIQSSLREVYAEPGIMTTKDDFCTFEYLLSENDIISIDIFNYNLDFVCRIVENVLRYKAATGSGRSTNKQEDRWDGTINNRGGRTVAPGIYYFKITAQKSKKTAVGKVVVAK